MSNNTNTGLGLLAGTAIGAILGILFAPDKGINTRQAIKEGANEAQKKLATETTVLKNKMMDEAGVIRNNLADTLSTKKLTLEEQLEGIVSDASYKADDLIVSLESKLAKLKAKNKKLQKTV
ncbi:YtxH domain-containing protein [Aquimarina agarivorans]|uniref:YtxH domain-containing protein n=1 Tax=Aquimarina agarivorans TaxID=980584 RepID=UPI000248EA32|nr:YtxH domain-containing protein [Aquimarina agarivorans]